MANKLEAIAEKKKKLALAKQEEDIARFAKKVAEEVVGKLDSNKTEEIQSTVAELATSVAEAVVASNKTFDGELKDSFTQLLLAVKKNKPDYTSQTELNKEIGKSLAKFETALETIEFNPEIMVEGLKQEDLKREVDRILAQLPSNSKREVTIGYEEATADKYINVRLTDGIKFYSAFSSGGGGGGNIDTSGLATSAKQDSVIAELQQLRGFQLPIYDEIEATYPTSSTELYTYKFETTEVATVEVTYTDSTKEVLSGVVFNAA